VTVPETTEIRRILPHLPLRTRWLRAGSADEKALQLAEQRGLAQTVPGQWDWTEWQLTPEGREWLAQWAKCSLCGCLTSEHAGSTVADWYLCGRCEGTPAAVAAGYTHERGETQ
jgi:formylmethanofuran dehydrogenase subunit E